MSHDPVVFVIDDDAAARESVAVLLRTSGLLVQTFESGALFLASLQRPPIGCVVCDVRMHEMSGLELQRKLAEAQVDLPFILITGYADVPTAVESMKQGAFFFLDKSCGKDELLKTVNHALDVERRTLESRERRLELKRRLATLSAGEHAVLVELLHGLANKQIAGKLDLGLRTIELRRSNVLKKMQAGSLAEVVQMAVECNVVA